MIDKSMKIEILFLFVIILVSSLTANSYAKPSNNSPPFIVFVQTQVRNSNGQIVAYLESSKILVAEPERLQKMLDVLPVSLTFTRGEQEFELIQIVTETPVKEPNAIARTTLVTAIDGKQVSLVYYIHDGFLIVPGDTITSAWSVIRPVR